MTGIGSASNRSFAVNSTLVLSGVVAATASMSLVARVVDGEDVVWVRWVGVGVGIAVRVGVVVGAGVAAAAKGCCSADTMS